MRSQPLASYRFLSASSVFPFSLLFLFPFELILGLLSLPPLYFSVASLNGPWCLFVHSFIFLCSVFLLFPIHSLTDPEDFPFSLPIALDRKPRNRSFDVHCDETLQAAGPLPARIIVTCTRDFDNPGDCHSNIHSTIDFFFID
jgi:hypothetical protein